VAIFSHSDPHGFPTNKQNTQTLDFIQAAKKYAQWTAYLPANYTAATTITATFIWAADSASTNSVVWGCQARSYADSDAIDQAFGAAVEVTDANNAQNDVNISDATGAITIANSPAPGHMIQFQVYRLGSGADNLAATAKLLQVIITYT
jgi:hypothetical protein